MDKYGYIRVAACVPSVTPADCDANATAIIASVKQAVAQGAQVIVTPELSVTGYTCADLFHNDLLLNASARAVKRIADEFASAEAMIVVGAPVRSGCGVYNCAIVLAHGSIKMMVTKSYLPNYNEFYEKRWFTTSTPGRCSVDYPCFGDCEIGNHLIFEVAGARVGVEICEDLWVPCPPSTAQALAGAEILINLSASDDLIGKYAYLRSLILQQSARCVAAYVYASAGYGESSTDLVFDGKAFIAENGKMLAQTTRWQSQPQMVVADIDVEALRRDRMHMGSFIDCVEANSYLGHCSTASLGVDAVANETLLRDVARLPFVPADERHRNERCDEIVNIQVAALAKRLDATHTKHLVIGISGGLDSTLALLVAAKTFDRLGLDRKGIVGVTMPGFGTTGRTYNNALTLMRSLGITIREIPIADAVMQHFHDIGHDPAVSDVTYENSQARERTQILMDIANQVGGMVLGTGDMSELALGWATYNGDHMSMYGVNAGIPKTLVRHLVRWFADNTDCADERAALLDIIDTPISPELTPAAADGTIAQKTEDLVGPYELHDFFLYYMLRYGFEPAKVYMLARKAFAGEYSDEEIKRWMRTFYRRFFNQQFKRSCLPDGPKVGSVCLSPRGDWRMPSDASSQLWLDAVDQL